MCVYVRACVCVPAHAHWKFHIYKEGTWCFTRLIFCEKKLVVHRMNSCDITLLFLINILLCRKIRAPYPQHKLSEGPGVLINPGKDEIGKFSIVPPTPNPNPYPEASLWGTEATIPLYFPCFPSPAPSESPRCVNYHSQHIPREATEKAHSLGRSPSIRPSPSLQHPYPRSK